MPIYEYICQSCEQPSELLIRSQSELPHCPFCGSADLKKLISVPGAVFSRVSGPASGCREQGCPAAGGGCGIPGKCCGGDL